MFRFRLLCTGKNEDLDYYIREAGDILGVNGKQHLGTRIYPCGTHTHMHACMLFRIYMSIHVTE